MSTERTDAAAPAVPHLSQIEQLAQLEWYFGEHYPRPKVAPPWNDAGEASNSIVHDRENMERWFAHVPDRLTHSAMMELGAAAGHVMPGVLWTDSVVIEDLTLPDGSQTRARRMTSPTPSTTWVVTVHGGGLWQGSGASLEHYWRPEMAALAQLSNAVVLDVDYPLLPENTLADAVASVCAAVAYSVENGADNVAVLGFSAGAVIATLASEAADALIVRNPDFSLFDALPPTLRGGADFPHTSQHVPPIYVQRASNDEVVGTGPDSLWERIPGLSPACTSTTYVSKHVIATPEVYRSRTKETASILDSLSQP